MRIGSHLEYCRKVEIRYFQRKAIPYKIILGQDKLVVCSGSIQIKIKVSRSERHFILPKHFFLDYAKIEACACIEYTYQTFRQPFYV